MSKEFTIVVPEAAPIHRRGLPYGGYDFGKPSRLVIAYQGNGAGLILWGVGGHFAVMYDMLGGTLDVAEYGLDYTVDTGVYIWEGHIVDTSTDGINGKDYDCELDGALRDPTADEWKLIMTGKAPWNDEEYKL